MQTETKLVKPLVTDARLVELSQEGNREAFGQIVARYQAPICALAYSGCGSVSRSEDIAQEVFIAAWRQLADLKHPEKFKAWLFAIARNLTNRSFRRQTRDPLATAESLDNDSEARSELSAPPEIVITKEEETILWRVLEAMPDSYREPMVLYYRQDESIAGVAEVLGVSEDVVRQRLSRGRAMLNERVAQVVARGLRRSGPTQAFGLAVIGALPLLATPAKAALGTAVVTGAKASSAQAVATIAYLASVLGAAAGGILAIFGRIAFAASARERKFLSRAWLGCLLWVFASFGFLCSRGDVIINDWRGAAAWGWVWLALFGTWVIYAVWMTRRQRAIQLQEGTFRDEGQLAGRFAGLNARGFKITVYGSLAAFIFASQFLLALAGRNDRTFLALLPIFELGLWLLSARAIVRRPERAGAVMNALWCAQTLFVLAAVNLRWNVWATPPQPFGLLPPFVNVLIFGFLGSFSLAWWLERHLLNTRNFRRDAAIALAAFVALVLLGLILFLSGVSKFYASGSLAAS